MLSRKTTIKLIVLMFFVISVLIFSSCSSNDDEFSYQTGDNYNCFERTQLPFEVNIPDEDKNEGISVAPNVEYVGEYNNSAIFIVQYSVGRIDDYSRFRTQIITFDGQEYTSLSFSGESWNKKPLVFWKIGDALYGWSPSIYGSELLCFSLTDYTVKNVLEKDGYVHIENIIFDGEHYLIGYDNLVEVYDSSWNFVTMKELDSDILHILKGNGQNILIFTTNKAYRFIDNKFTEDSQYTVKLPENLGWDYMYNGDETYDFYCTLRSLLSGDVEVDKVLYGVKDGKYVRIFDFQQMGLENFDQVIALGDGKYMVRCWKSGYEGNEFYILSPSSEEHNYSISSGKTIITFASINGFTSYEKVITSFNSVSDDYYIEMVSYDTSDSTLEEAFNEIALDAVSGKQIDMICLNGINKKMLTEKDILWDLSQYFNGNSVIDKNDVYSNVWDGWEDDEGSIYSIFPDYILQGFFYAPGTPKEDLWKCIPANDLNSLYQIIRFSGNEIVDVETKTCHLDDGFQVFLSNCATSWQDGSPNVQGTDTVLVQDGVRKGLYQEIAIPYGYFYYRNLFQDDFQCSNYGWNSPVIDPGPAEIGVTSYSDSKDGVIEFLNYMFSDDIYNQFFGNVRFPILASFMNDWEIRLSSDEDYIDRFGERIIAGGYWYEVNGVSMTLYSFSDEEIDEMRNFVESAKYVSPLDTKYCNIILEEAQSYLGKDKELDQVINTMESRLQTVLNEE